MTSIFLALVCFFFNSLLLGEKPVNDDSLDNAFKKEKVNWFYQTQYPDSSFNDDFVKEHCYKRGFLYCTTKPRLLPLNYRQIASYLWIDKSLEYAISPDKSVYIFGLVVDARDENRELKSIATNLALKLQNSEESFHKEGDFLCGRFAIIYTFNGKQKIVTDAAGLRGIYHSGNAEIIAGHAKLVADNLSEKSVELAQTNLGNGSFGRITPYSNVFTLIPNTSCEIGTGKIQRFYPRQSIKTLKVDDAARKVVPWVLTALKGAAKRKPLVISVTSGIDSRSTLAVSRALDKRPTYFSYCNIVNNPQTCMDAAFAQDMCLALKLPYKKIIVDREENKLQNHLLAIMQTNTFRSHIRLTAQMLAQTFEDKFIHIRSNLLEIGRAYFGDFDVKDASESEIYKLFLDLGNVNKSVEPLLRSAFKDYIKTTNFNSASLFNYDPRDIYFWEQDAGWVAQVLIEQDIAYETFIPWNSRVVLEHMLQVDFDDRDNGRLFKAIINRFCPELKKWPINPEEWPLNK